MNRFRAGPGEIGAQLLQGAALWLRGRGNCCAGGSGRKKSGGDEVVQAAGIRTALAEGEGPQWLGETADHGPPAGFATGP